MAYLFGMNARMNTATQTAQLWSIATQCPLSGGKAVFRARSLYLLIDPAADFGNDYAICNAGGIVLLEAGTNTNDPLAWEAEKRTTSTAREIGEVQIFPNPATDRIHLSIPHTNPVEWVELRDLTGKVILRRIAPAHESELDVSPLAAGMYYLTVRYSDGEEAAHRIVIL